MGDGASEQTTTHRPSAHSERWSRAFIGLAVASTAFVALHRERESDVFWHLNQGRAVLRYLSRVVPEPSAFPELVRRTPVAAWLWDVLTYLCYRAAGFPALAWLTAACTLLAGLALAFMLRAVRDEAPPAARVLVAGVALACMTSRVRARPELMALLAAPLLIGTLLRFVRAERTRARLWLGLAAALTALGWAQLHGSFLLVPAIGAAILAEPLLRSKRGAERTALLALVFVLLLATLSSTAGANLIAYGLEHGSTDIKLHNAEMHAPVWGSFNPVSSVFGPLYLLMAGLGVVGLCSLGRGVLAELGLALLGVAVVSQSVRFFAVGTLLSAPLALHGVSELTQRARGLRATAVLLGCSVVSSLLLYRVVMRAQESIGPLGTLGVVSSELPMASAKYLARLPEDSRVLSTYDAGGSLGFFLDGRVRTFVDSRTMVLFDDLQFALARDAFRSRGNLQRAARRYGATAVVVRRSDQICAELQAPWVPVVVEPVWTTFVRLPDVQGLRGVAPCGRDWLLPGACDEQGALVSEDLARLRKLQPSPLLDFLDATRAAACQRDLRAASRLLPSAARSEGFERARDRLAAQLAFAQRDGRAGLHALARWAERADLDAWDLLRAALRGGLVSSEQLLPLAQRAVALLDDRTPVFLRELLAELCIDRGELGCARFHGMRAVLGGSPDAHSLLRWLAQHGPDESARRDATEWLQALEAAPSGTRMGMPPHAEDLLDQELPQGGAEVE
jgi:hypothetical protein